MERLNAVLEDYLRHFVSERQDGWSRWLPLAEFANNNSVSASTGFSPFFACTGYHPRSNSLTHSSSVPRADEFAKYIQEIQSTFKDHLETAKSRQAVYYNADKRVDVVYQPGDLVWLSRKFIKTWRPSQKLDFRRIGQFRVVRMVGKNAVELSLSAEYARIHPVFDVALVMPVHDPADLIHRNVPGIDPPQAQVRLEEGRMARWLVVDLIMDHRLTVDGHQYLLRTEPTGVNDAWVSLQYISRGLDHFIQAYHEIHDEHARPSYDVFEDLSRPDVGYLAEAQIGD